MIISRKNTKEPWQKAFAWQTNTPHVSEKYKQTVLQRLMIAQDTGGAIKGKVRGDVFWGAGPKATYIAGKMQNKGQYWLLIPKHCVIKINNNV